MALTKVTSGVRTLGTGEVATANMATDPTNASNLSSGSVPLAQLGNAPATDTSGIEDDIAVLGFKVAANGSLAKYNLVDQVVDAFEDGTGIDTSGSTNQFLTDKYVVGSSAHDGTGGTITTNGSDTIHRFNSSGTFSNATSTTSLRYLVIAGAGSGGSGYAGGGGAGGFRTATGFTVVAEQDYPITVGTGGAAQTYSGPGVNGTNSVFSTITSAGGGFGGFGGSGGGAGGSGGGGNDARPGGAGNTPSTSPVQGYVGGYGPGNYGGGGGGAGQAGHNASPGAGGNGTASDILGSSTTFAGGGGGGSASPSVNGAAGGSGGGGPGGKGTSDGLQGPTGSVGVAGTANTGSGGGGGGYDMGGPGADGTVVLRYTTVTKVIADLTLVSTLATSTDAVTKGDIVMTYTNGAGTASLNTDLKGFVSRDNGANYTEGTLVAEGTTGGHLLASFHNLTLGGTDTSQVKYKITTHNQSASKETRIQAVSLGWS